MSDLSLLPIRALRVGYTRRRTGISGGVGVILGIFLLSYSYYIIYSCYLNHSCLQIMGDLSLLPVRGSRVGDTRRRKGISWGG